MESYKRKSSYALIGAILVTALSIGGCTSQSTPDATGGNAALVQDVLGLRDDNGLFRMPESDKLPTGDLYTTALYLTVDSKKKLVEGFNPSEVDQKVAASDLTDVTAFWSTVTLDESASDLSTSVLARHPQVLQLPPLQTSAGAEVGALWACAASIRGLKKLSLPLPSTAEATKRLTDISVDSVKAFPYLVWRLSDAYDALGVTKPASLTKVLTSLSVSALPTNPESTFDTQAVVEAAKVAQHEPLLPSGMVEHLKSLLSSGRVYEDIVKVSILRTLTLLGQEEFVQRYLQDEVIAKRVDSASGLVRPVVQYPGTVEGAYLASRLLDQDFSKVVTDATKSSLLEAIASKQIDQLTKLKALVALRRTGDVRWKDKLAVADAVKNTLPKVVTVDQVANYLSTVDALVQVEDTVVFSRLQKFEPSVADNSQSLLALQVLTKSAYFSNATEVKNWFLGQQKSLETLIAEPSEPLSLYVAGLTAMTSAPAAGLTSPQFDAATKNLKQIEGCGSYKKLYRSAIDSTAPCSLALSVQLMAVPGAYETEGDK